MQNTTFFRQFIKHFFEIGAILPSSGAACREMTSHLARKSGAVRVLEVGAGTGPVTAKIVPLLQPGDALDIVEINPDLMAIVRRRFQQEPGFRTDGITIRFLTEDIRQAPLESGYDFILFSLPLTNFPPSMVKEILDLMILHLKPGGQFSYIKYIFLGRVKYLFSGSAARAEIQTRQKILHDFTNRYQIERCAVLRNVPPAWIYHWQKPVW